MYGRKTRLILVAHMRSPMQASRSFLCTFGLLIRPWICEESLSLLAAQSSTVS